MDGVSAIVPDRAIQAPVEVYFSVWALPSPECHFGTGLECKSIQELVSEVRIVLDSPASQVKGVVTVVPEDDVLVIKIVVLGSSRILVT